MPSPSMRQIDSSTTSGGRPTAWPALGMLAGAAKGSPVSRAWIMGEGSSPDGQVCSCLVPASQASTSATYSAWCCSRLEMGLSPML